jgi:hypothetical protein
MGEETTRCGPDFRSSSCSASSIEKAKDLPPSRLLVLISEAVAFTSTPSSSSSSVLKLPPYSHNYRAAVLPFVATD